MKRATLVLPDWIALKLAAAARNELETAGVLIVGVGRGDHELRLLGRELHFIPDDGYDERRSDGLSIPSSAYVRALAQAEASGATAMFFHTHPSYVAEPRPSDWDDRVDDQLVDTFRVRTGSAVYSSLVISPADSFFSFTARGVDDDEDFEVERVLVVGDRLTVLSSLDARPNARVGPMFDRNVRAFGGGIQTALSTLCVGVVGCGGTGSAVSEQLIRLGVRSMVLLDHDVLVDSNVTRVYGSTPSDVGRPKVTVLAAHLSRIAPDAELRTIRHSVLDERAARALAGCDVVFGCTDDNAGRLVLTRLSAYYLLPFIDCGVLISSELGTIGSIHGRVTVQTPGAACLVCRNRVDLARAAAEQLPTDELVERQREGYAPELGGREPAVVTFTTAVASQAVTELLERLTAFGPEPVPTEILLRFHDREMSGNRVEPKPGHYCHPASGKLAAGDTDPFVGQLWRAS